MMMTLIASQEKLVLKGMIEETVEAIKPLDKSNEVL
jgi:hypothetical protein